MEHGEHLRADARRNLERILRAASEVFATRGAGASIADIARRAGVGEATVVRRFPTKDDLLVALLGQRTTALAALAAHEGGRPPAAEALERFMGAMAQGMVHDRGLVEVLSDRRLTMAPALRDQRALLHRNVAVLLRGAQAGGRVRHELLPTDVLHLVGAVARAPFANMPDPELWRRYLAIVIAGMRPSSSPLPPRPLPPTLAELEAAAAAAEPEPEPPAP